jgi:hypothetical protein
MSRTACLILAALFMLSLPLVSRPAQSSQTSKAQTEWIANSLREIQKIKVGMRRADLLKVFTTEGGISTGLRRTYVYRACAYIKVDVEFDAVGRPARDSEGRVTLVESDRDIILKISKPYLEWNVLD